VTFEHAAGAPAFRDSGVQQSYRARQTWVSGTRAENGDSFAPCDEVYSSLTDANAADFVKRGEGRAASSRRRAGDSGSGERHGLPAPTDEIAPSNDPSVTPVA
jgi:hypothetical protein